MYEYTAVRRINKRRDYIFLHSRRLTGTKNCTLMCGLEGGESWNIFRCATMYRVFQKRQLNSHLNFESTEKNNVKHNEELW